MLEYLIDKYQETPSPEMLEAYDAFAKRWKSIDKESDAEVLSSFAATVERAAFRAGFSAAMTLMHEIAVR